MSLKEQELLGALLAAETEMSLATSAKDKVISELRRHYLASDTFHPEHSCIRWLASFATTDPAYKDRSGIYQRSSVSYGVSDATRYGMGDLFYHQNGFALELLWYREGRTDVSLGKIDFRPADAMMEARKTNG